MTPEQIRSATVARLLQPTVDLVSAIRDADDQHRAMILRIAIDAHRRTVHMLRTMLDKIPRVIA